MLLPKKVCVSVCVCTPFNVFDSAWLLVSDLVGPLGLVRRGEEIATCVVTCFLFFLKVILTNQLDILFPWLLRPLPYSLYP